jgi:hypothetical protein
MFAKSDPQEVKLQQQRMHLLRKHPNRNTTGHVTIKRCSYDEVQRQIRRKSDLNIMFLYLCKDEAKGEVLKSAVKAKRT